MASVVSPSRYNGNGPGGGKQVRLGEVKVSTVFVPKMAGENKLGSGGQDQKLQIPATGARAITRREAGQLRLSAFRSPPLPPSSVSLTSNSHLPPPPYSPSTPIIFSTSPTTDSRSHPLSQPSEQSNQTLSPKIMPVKSNENPSSRTQIAELENSSSTTSTTVINTTSTTLQQTSLAESCPVDFTVSSLKQPPSSFSLRRSAPHTYNRKLTTSLNSTERFDRSSSLPQQLSLLKSPTSVGPELPMSPSTLLSTATLSKTLNSRRSAELHTIYSDSNHTSITTTTTTATSEDYSHSSFNECAVNSSLPSVSARINHLDVPLQSPCFYHQRFDTAINVERVLEEIASDDSDIQSHSRLMQTALGVREVARQLQRKTCKVAMRNIMIVTKARDNELVYKTRELAQWLMQTPRYGRSLGVTVYVDKKLQNSKRFDAKGLLEERPEFEDMLKYWTPDLCWTNPETFDLVLTLGGDGTVLFTSWLFQRVVPPILSFSLGSLGFLTNFSFKHYKEILNKILLDGMRVNMRMRFTCTVYRQENGEAVEKDQFEVLNELVIDRGPSPYVSHLELYGDNDLLTVVQADGCIFSTPTGSTAYSLSAGGSLVHPDIPAILLTPICPHTLSFRPMLLNDSMLLRVVVPKGSRATAWCAFDGKGRVELRQGDYVTIAASQYPFPTVLSGSKDWFDSVSRTLRWNTRSAQQKAFDASGAADVEEAWDIDTEQISEEDASSDGTSPVAKRLALLGLG